VRPTQVVPERWAPVTRMGVLSAFIQVCLAICSELRQVKYCDSCKPFLTCRKLFDLQSWRKMIVGSFFSAVFSEETGVAQSTHRTILVSSSLMGMQQVVRLAVGVVQSKIVAVLLGPAGTGSFGAYASLMNLWQSLFGLGIVGSGVRHIAASHALDRTAAPSRDIQTLLRVVAFLAGLAGVTMFLFRAPISRLTFDTTAYAPGIGFIAGATALALMTSSLLTVLKGMRRIRDLTFANVLGALLSAALSILVIYLYREDGIAAAFLAASACSCLAAWLWFRRIDMRKPEALPWRDAWRRVADLVRLGGGFMSVSLFVTLTAYAVRALLTRYHGIQSAGIYQSAWMLSSFYCTMVLQAMGTDFLPRISAVCEDKDVFNRQVNEQTEVGMVMVVPGILFCMVAAVPILRVLYTAEFLQGVQVARWMMAGMLVRVAGWPLAYIPLARNRPLVTFVTEGLFSMVFIGLGIVLIPGAGVDGAGLAFFLTSLVYTGVLVVMARRISGFRWSRRCLRSIAGAYIAGGTVFGLLLSSAVAAYYTAVSIVVGVVALSAYRILHIYFVGKRGAFADNQ
jgi:enterobacterial common antigen flippase